MNDDKFSEQRWPSSRRRLLKRGGFFLLALVPLLFILGLIPVSTDRLESSSTPAATYEEAVLRFEAIGVAEAPMVTDHARSRLLSAGGKTAEVYVLIHGISASPYQWEEFGNLLLERGHNVLILRMPHHGLRSNDVDELRRMDAEELRAYADEAIDIARGLGEEITVIGLSGGGTVTAWIGQNRPDVHRVLALSPFFGVPELPQFLNTFAMNLLARTPNIDLINRAVPQRDWVYPGQSTHSVTQYARLGKSVFGKAAEEPPPVKAAYFVTTAIDDTADNDYTMELARIWAEAGIDVSSYEFSESHAIPHASIEPGVDPQKKVQVYAQILEMLDEPPMD